MDDVMSTSKYEKAERAARPMRQFLATGPSGVLAIAGSEVVAGRAGVTVRVLRGVESRLPTRG